MTTKPTIIWFQQDLRIQDNYALTAAAKKNGPIIPIYIWSPEEEGQWAPGAASRWWLHHSLETLQSNLKAMGLDLIIRTGSSLPNLLQIANESGADSIYWHRRYEPHILQRDRIITSELEKHNLTAKIFSGALLFEPEQILTSQNRPFTVFTPFWNSCLKLQNIPLPLPSAKDLIGYKNPIESVSVKSLGLLPKIHWDEGLQNSWQPGETNAQQALNTARSKVVGQYAVTRDRPDLPGTSKLSPYLHFGEISPRQIWHALNQTEASPFLRQLGWREFGHYLLYHFPHTPTMAFQNKFDAFPWKMDTHLLHAWQKGQTGYPLVDAGMRELWHTGWMHNRVRMVTASFLTKDLMLPWQSGAEWFWDTLVDADLANNTLGWQWTAGCGADAAPYFRVFNPTLQGNKFDETKAYVRKWVPELQDLSDKWIYSPWLAPTEELRKAGIALGSTYPYPIVDHDTARKEALAAYHNQI